MECREARSPHLAIAEKSTPYSVAAERVAEDGFDAIKTRLAGGDISYLQTFPFMGPATSYHLAKNLGMDVVKPDRHLLRITCAVGYESPDAMCRDIGTTVGERLSVVDLVLWRYATLNPAYLDDFSTAAPASSRTMQAAPAG